MDKCWEIFKEKELKSIKKEEKMYKTVYKEFCKTSNPKYRFNYFSSYNTVVAMLENCLYESQRKEEIDLLFNILKKYNYRMQWEICYAIQGLAFLEDPNNNTEKIKFYLNSPTIDDISFNGIDAFEIFSEECGKFTFQLADKYLNDRDIGNYIKKNRYNGMCHEHTYNMAQWYPNYYAITSLVENRFLGSFHHSNTYDSDRNVIIDLRFNSVMDKEASDNLYHSQCVSKTLNSELNSEIDIVNQKIKLKKVKAEVLRVALYKEYLNSIGYTGPIEKGPSLKKSIY